MIVLRSGLNEEGTKEFYLVGLDSYEDFPQVVDQFTFLGTDIIEQVDGIYSRIALAVITGKRFKIIYHEDVGMYAYATGSAVEETTTWLAQTLETVVENLNKSGSQE